MEGDSTQNECVVDIGTSSGETQSENPESVNLNLSSIPIPGSPSGVNVENSLITGNTETVGVSSPDKNSLLAKEDADKLVEKMSTIKPDPDTEILKDVCDKSCDNSPDEADENKVANDNKSEQCEMIETNPTIVKQNNLKKESEENNLTCATEEKTDIDTKETSEKNTKLNDKDRLKIYCSTPVGDKNIAQVLKLSVNPSTSNDFGLISPLDKSSVNKKKAFKRKNLELDCIEEENEDVSEKKIKTNSNQTEDINQLETSELSCFEPPAKSILKKWQPSCMPRSSTSSFIDWNALDESGENDEENKKANQELSEASTADNFEVEYKSLQEVIYPKNIEALEKYCSQVEHESQINDERFDELLLEIEENNLAISDSDKTNLLVKTMDISDSESQDKVSSQSNSVSELNLTVIEVTTSKTVNVNKESNSNDQDIPSKETSVNNPTSSDESNIKVTIKVKEETESENPADPNTVNDDTISNAEKLSIVYADGKDMTMDEEDFLLEEDLSSKKKPYEFFEFVSNDPKENEDNYNPEWQKLGRLTSDEERYKAVRDRWRSLVPPDPNRDLTCRQWRQKNNKSFLSLPNRNNNNEMFADEERNQLCTQVFDMKIKKIVQELQNGRKNIHIKRNMAFEELALTQDEEQRRLILRGGNEMNMAGLHKHHIEECRKLKDDFDLELSRITNVTNEKIRVLKEASEEVLLFQKFYKGVGASDDEGCLYMTDTQVQELMETENMLEQYAIFYR